jgi:predicted nucleic acid-binding protein
MSPPQQVAIDASVVLSRLLAEARPPWVDAAFEDAQEGAIELIAPPLLWLEIGNRLVRARGVGDEFALEAMLRAEALGITPAEVERPIRLRALQLAREHRLSMYDAVYLAVAESTRSPLLTLDRRLADAAAAMGLGREGGSRRVSEPTASYGDRPGDPTSIAAIGAALAEMRKEYSL